MKTLILYYSVCNYENIVNTLGDKLDADIEKLNIINFKKYTPFIKPLSSNISIYNRIIVILTIDSKDKIDLFKNLINKINKYIILILIYQKNYKELNEIKADKLIKIKINDYSELDLNTILNKI